MSLLNAVKLLAGAGLVVGGGVLLWINSEWYGDKKAEKEVAVESTYIKAPTPLRTQKVDLEAPGMWGGEVDTPEKISPEVPSPEEASSEAPVPPKRDYQALVREIRATLEASFPGRHFPTSKPKWLRSPKGSHMELTCYNKDLKLGVNCLGDYAEDSEYQERRERDELKRFLCEKKGVSLIEVPHSMMVEEVGEFLHQELERIGLGREVA